MKKITAGQNSVWVMSIGVLIAFLWGWMFYLTPCQVDDLMFQGTYREYNSGSDSFSINAWVDFVREIRQLDTSRIGNILMIPSTLWSPWKEIFPWLTGGMVAMMLWLSARFGMGRRNVGVTAMCLMWLAATLFLPWRNYLVTVTYSLNYVYAAVLTLVIIRLLLNVRDWGWRFWVCLGCCAAAGWWHEGFAATTLCGMGVVMLLRRGRMPVQWWICCLTYGIIMLILVSSPLVVGRIEQETGSSGAWRSAAFAFDSLTTAAMLAVTLLAALSARGRRYLSGLLAEGYFPVFVVISLTGLLLAVLFNYTPRVCFWPSLGAIIALMMLARPVIDRMGKKWGMIFSGATIILLTAHMGVCIFWQQRYHEQNREITEAIAKSPRGTIYYDIIKPSECPRYTLYFPSKVCWTVLFQYVSLSEATGLGEVAVVPTELRTASPADAEKVESNLPLYRAGESIFVDPTDIPSLRPNEGMACYHISPIICDVTLTDGSTASFISALPLYYTNEAGERLMYLYLNGMDARQVSRIMVDVTEPLQIFEPEAWRNKYPTAE